MPTMHTTSTSEHVQMGSQFTIVMSICTCADKGIHLDLTTELKATFAWVLPIAA